MLNENEKTKLIEQIVRGKGTIIVKHNSIYFLKERQEKRVLFE